MAKKANVTKEKRVRLYENDFLEALTRIHPAIPVFLWGPVALGSIWMGWNAGLGAGRVAGLAAAGLLAWTLTEYVLHRWVFHWQPKNEKLREFLYPMHELHHDVQEWDRLLAPPMMAIPLFSAIVAGFFWLLGTPTVFPFTGGFTIGYLCYDYIHFYTHFVTPKSAIGKGLRRRHLQHHFACEDRWYGVSSPLWDYVFRTHVPRGERPSEMSGSH